MGQKYSINAAMEFDCELREYCSAVLAPGVCMPHVPKDLFCRVVHEGDCQAAVGLLFELSMTGAVSEFAVSDEDGLLVFFPLCPGSYRLEMISEDSGVHTLKEAYTVVSDAYGRVCIDTVPAQLSRICVVGNSPDRNPDRNEVDL